MTEYSIPHSFLDIDKCLCIYVGKYNDEKQEDRMEEDRMGEDRRSDLYCPVYLSGLSNKCTVAYYKTLFSAYSKIKTHKYFG